MKMSFCGMPCRCAQDMPLSRLGILLVVGFLLTLGVWTSAQSVEDRFTIVEDVGGRVQRPADREGAARQTGGLDRCLLEPRPGASEDRREADARHFDLVWAAVPDGVVPA